MKAHQSTGVVIPQHWARTVAEVARLRAEVDDTASALRTCDMAECDHNAVLARSVMWRPMTEWVRLEAAVAQLRW